MNNMPQLNCQRCNLMFDVEKVSDAVRIKKQILCPDCVDEVREKTGNEHNLQGRFESPENFGENGRYTKADFRGRK